MKPYLSIRAAARCRFLTLVLAIGLVLPLPALAASVALATAPLATSTTSTVKPNVLFVLDDSGSMAFTYMPDAADSFRTRYGYHSNQCNALYYNPNITYLPPVDSTGTAYADASFTAALDNGFDSGSPDRNLNSEFIANRFDPSGANSTFSGYGSYLGTNSLGPYGAFYYAYSGAQFTKDYNNTSSTFYTECNTSIGSATSVFSKRRLATTESTTITFSGTSSTSVSSITVGSSANLLNAAVGSTSSSSTMATNIAAQIHAKVATTGYDATASGSTVTITGPTSAANSAPVITKSGSMTFVTDVFPDTTAANLTNFANWYSYYRSRMLMMKTATGRAFSILDSKYRVGFMRINSSGTPALSLGTYETTQRSNWYSTLYNSTYSTGGTPLRKALANAGRYYAGKLSVTDPLQYSCQQNFTILSTDGYWNESSGFNKLDGSTPVGNQDGTAGRPMFDGTQATSRWTFTYTRNSYSKSRNPCSGSYKKLKTQPEIGTCTTSSATASCAPSSSNWISDGSSFYSGSCTSSGNISYPGGNSTSAPVQQGEPVETAGSSGGTSNTLADVAMYYYQTDLRTPAENNCGTPSDTGPLCENNVFQGPTDRNLQQHMTTFTLGLGASGRMKYSSSYLADSVGDYVAVKQGTPASSTVCTWQSSSSGACNWPTPGADAVENIDDLWHAAVNGRGAYFSATDPTTLSAGLSNALKSIDSKTGAAAAAATSTLNPVAGNNFAYVASYTTVAWKGNLEARSINTDTGVVSENASWCVQDVPAQTCAPPGTIEPEDIGDTTIYNCVTPNTVVCTEGELVGTDCKVPIATACAGTMNALVSDASDTRLIYTADSAGTGLAAFDAAYATANPANFSAAHISGLSQWSTLTAGQKTAAAGVNLVNYLRGQHGHEFDRSANADVDQLYRNREAVLGDALESQPAFMAEPVFSYSYPGYSSFLSDQAGRAGTVYMGANDGMMHAFAADNGIERWAYVPSMVIPNLWRLADTSYATLHTNYVNGSAITSDICSAGCGDSAAAVWKTILVAGLNGGGRGYYALDITVPDAPALLWEFTPARDSALGYSYGRPIITRKADGTWVVLVTSGYDNGALSSDPLVNNSPAGNGVGYLYVLNAATGAIISKISTGVGSATAPSGLAKIAGWNIEPAGNAAGFVYGGDLLGNVWRFDINSSVGAAIGTGSAMKFATLFADAGATSPQPVTTTPILGEINGKRIVFIGTGKYLETSDLTSIQLQTQYAIKDDDAGATLVNPRNTLVRQFLINNPDGTASRLSSGTSATDAATATNKVDFFTDRGWYVDFPDSGERANIDSKLVQGTLLVPTIVPSNTVCSPGGFGWLNFLDYKTGGSITPLPGTPLASTKYDATIVGINVLFIEGSPIVEVVTSTDPTPKKDPDAAFNANAAGFAAKRVIWRELIP